MNRCNWAIDPTCVNDTIFAGIEALIGKFVVSLPIVHTNINPSSENYREYYLTDQNFFTFSSQLGVMAFANIRED